MHNAQQPEDIGNGENKTREGAMEKGKGQRTKGKGQRAKGKGQRAKGKGQRAKGKGQRAKDKGQRTKDKGQRAKGKGQRANGKGKGQRAKGKKEENTSKFATLDKRCECVAYYAHQLPLAVRKDRTMSEYVKLATGAADQYLTALADSQEQFLKTMATFNSLLPKVAAPAIPVPAFAA